MATKADVLERLSKVRGPDLKGDIVSLGLVSAPLIEGRRVILSITVPPERAAELEPLRQAAERAVVALDDVDEALVSLTAERPIPATPPSPPPRSAVRREQPAEPQKAGVPGVKAIIAVASGKGGVGKSTTAVNLALGLQAEGHVVGVLDADIYGPSMPRLLGLSGRPEPVAGKVLKPLEGYGLRVMSMGFLVEEETPMIWRGPMVMSALTQMLREVAWGELDFLVVDMPPGTGDAQLTMAQQVPLAGAVIVSTPQDLALIDARKGLNMFRKVDVPILGIIENMSNFVCPACGTVSDIFGHGGAQSEAERLGVPFLGGVPLHMDIRASADGGRPIVISDPDGPHAQAYRTIARRVADRSAHEAGLQGRAAPKIVVE